uniref:VWFA domain-containing protein n=1 Tax=Syphacia muris TaxID=451379 RepID=A0A0N5AVC3_9BILA
MNIVYKVLLYYVLYCMTITIGYCGNSHLKHQNYASLGTHMVVDEFQKSIRRQVNELLGITEMQRIVDGLSFKQITVNENVLIEATNELDSELGKYIAALNSTHDFLVNSCQISKTKCGCFHHDFSGFYIYPSLPECSTVLPSFLRQWFRYSEQYDTPVNVSYACCILSQEAQHCEKNFHYGNLTSVFKSNSKLNAIRWQYVTNMAGVQLEYPAHVFPTSRRRHWAPFLSSALPYKKRILILLDTGTVQSEAQLSKLKGISKLLLDFAASGDRLMAMADIGTGTHTACNTESFVEATADNSAALRNFVTGLSFMYVGLLPEMTFQDERILRESGSFVNYYNVIFYISRGVMSDLNETESVLEALAEIATKTDVRIKINTIAFSEGGRELMRWSASFLKNVAEQNYTNYKRYFSKDLREAVENAELNPPAGEVNLIKCYIIAYFSNISLSRLFLRIFETIIVNGSENSQLTLMKVYSFLSDREMLKRSEDFNWKKIYWSVPFIEFFESESPMISISKTVRDKDGLVAVVGMDIVLDRIADILRYRDEVLMETRGFSVHFLVCDYKGRVIIDSRLATVNLWLLHISVVDGWNIEDRYLGDVFGDMEFNDGSFEVRKNITSDIRQIRYVWRRLKNAPFVLVLAVNTGPNREDPVVTVLSSNNTTNLPIKEQFLCHHLILERDKSFQNCMHYGSLSSFQYGCVFLSSSCFESSLYLQDSSPEWLQILQITLSTQFYLVCVKFTTVADRVDLSFNIGIRRGVREHVFALWKIIKYWKIVVLKFKNQVIRHYIATPLGIMLTYPATVIRQEYRPTTQSWYTRALKYPGRIVFTGPKLDSKLGLIVTVSTAIFEGRAKRMHNSETDQVFAVIAMDVPVGFLLRVLRDNVPACKQQRRCILFDDVGYVLARGIETGFPVKELNLSGRSSLADAVEKFHVSHLEPQLATHLITNSLLVKKQQCTDWKTRSYGRYFQYNVTFKDVLTLPCGDNGYSSVGSAKGIRAEVISVPQSNIFLVLMNESCSFAHQAFCPCSVLDRRCLLCSRFDDTECECPCQCPVYSEKSCKNSSYEEADLMQVLLVDSFVSDCAEKSSTFYTSSQESIQYPECIPARCEDYHTLDDCLTGIGCQWCATTEDGESLLESPYCSAVDQCYGGVRGRQLKDVIDSSGRTSAQYSMATPVGAVAAGIMSVMGVYCYRNQVNRYVESRSLTDSFGTPICPHDDDAFQLDYDDSPDGKRICILLCHVLASFEQLSNTRPIVRSQCRPAPRTESSDQGYSTMTDRLGGEESEGASSSINISRHTERTFLMPLPTCINEDCSNSVVVEADVHHVPSFVGVS